MNPYPLIWQSWIVIHDSNTMVAPIFPGLEYLYLPYSWQYTSVVSHPHRHKTLELITRNFFWPEMDEWIRNYIRTCETCQWNKSSRHAKYGLLQPLDTPYAPWRSISVDFIVALPESQGMNQIMVVVDRFTKMGHFIPLTGESSAKDCANAFLKNVWKLHGLPDEIISDRDTKWTSEFWKNLGEIMGIKRNLSTAFHPQSDGQTERLNQTLEQYLRTFINYDQDDWNQLLPLKNTPITIRSPLLQKWARSMPTTATTAEPIGQRKEKPGTRPRNYMPTGWNRSIREQEKTWKPPRVRWGATTTKNI